MKVKVSVYHEGTGLLTHEKVKEAESPKAVAAMFYRCALANGHSPTVRQVREGYCFQYDKDRAGVSGEMWIEAVREPQEGPEASPEDNWPPFSQN